MNCGRDHSRIGIFYGESCVPVLLGGYPQELQVKEQKRKAVVRKVALRQLQPKLPAQKEMKAQLNRVQGSHCVFGEARQLMLHEDYSPPPTLSD